MTRDEAVDEYAVATWRSRLWRRLFPQQPSPRLRDDPRTYLTTRIYLVVSWDDRLRLLLTGRALVQVTTYTDVVVGDVESLSTFTVEP